MPKMLIMPGLIDTIPPSGHPNPKGLLDRPSAERYAALRGYEPLELDVADHHTGPYTNQTKAALAKFRADKEVTALYGFSGGGYNITHLLRQLTPKERQRIKLIVVIGAPEAPALKGPWEFIHYGNPPSGHMHGPATVLAKWEADHPPTDTA